MQRGILKICLRTTDNKTNTAEIAKVCYLSDFVFNLHDLRAEFDCSSLATP
jgi:hypothetical protein